MAHLMKQSRPGFHHGPIRHHQYPKDADLCIVHNFINYIKKMEEVRTDDKCFISLQAPHKGVARGTVSR